MVALALASWPGPVGAARAEQFEATLRVVVRFGSTPGPRLKGEGVTTLDHVWQTLPAVVIGLVVGAGLALYAQRRARRALLPGARAGGVEEVDVREERFRRAALAVSMPQALLAAPALLESVGWHDSLFASGLGSERFSYGFFGGGSGALQPHPMELPSAVFALAWPLFLGGVSLVRGLLRRPPGLAESVTWVVMFLLGGPAVINLTFEWGKVPGRQVLSVLVTGLLLALLVLGRGFLRRGWERWVHLTTCGWLFYTTVTVALALVESWVYDWPEPGLWCVVFALSAMLTGSLWALVRGEGQGDEVGHV
jgi:hypothetical protein